MKNTLWLIFLAWCSTLATGFDLGPIVRTAQCRSQCLKQHTADGSCDNLLDTGYHQTTGSCEMVSKKLSFPSSSFFFADLLVVSYCSSVAYRSFYPNLFFTQTPKTLKASSYRSLNFLVSNIESGWNTRRYFSRWMTNQA